MADYSVKCSGCGYRGKADTTEEYNASVFGPDGNLSPTWCPSDIYTAFGDCPRCGDTLLWDDAKDLAEQRAVVLR